MSTKGVFKRCGCRCPVTGKQLGARCGRLDEPGHGSWWFAVEGPQAAVSADGSRSRVRRGGYASEEAAMAARDQVAATTKGIGLTTGHWLESRVRNVRLRPSTRRNYRQHVDTYLIPQLGDLPLVTLSVGDVQKAFAAIAAGDGSRYGRLAPSTVARVRAKLSSALTAAVGNELLAHNPARGREIELPEVVRPRPYVWTEARVALADDGMAPGAGVRVDARADDRVPQGHRPTQALPVLPPCGRDWPASQRSRCVARGRC